MYRCLHPILDDCDSFSYLSCSSFNSIFHMIFIPFLSVGILGSAWILHRTRKLELIVNENLGFIIVSTQGIMQFNVFLIGRKTRIFRIEFLKQWFQIGFGHTILPQSYYDLSFSIFQQKSRSSLDSFYILFNISIFDPSLSSTWYLQSNFYFNFI